MTPGDIETSLGGSFWKKLHIMDAWRRLLCTQARVGLGESEVVGLLNMSWVDGIL